jgi:endonuclease III
MSRESFITKQERIGKIIFSLKVPYPDAHCELIHSNPLQLLIATILSAQCSDKQVNLVTENLFKLYGTARDFAEAPIPDLEKHLQRLGLFRNKARNIQAACRKLIEKHDGQVPPVMDELIQLNGVGRKTANVVLGNAFGINEGFVVDTHVSRLSTRLGLSDQTDPVKIEKDLMRLVEREKWMLFSHLLIWHGRRRCHARNPDCSNCEIKDLCPAEQLN